MKSFHVYDVKKEFQAIQRYFNGWNPDTMQPMKKDIDKYFQLKDEIVQKYCTQNIMRNNKEIILYADEQYEELIIWDEIFHIGDKVLSYWLSGNIEGTIEKMKVYFSTVSWQLEWEMEIKLNNGTLLKVKEPNSPHLLSTLQQV